MAEFSFGLDPEFVVIRDKKPVAAPYVINAGKEAPLTTHIGDIFYDNANLECTIPPGYSEDEVISNIKEMLSTVHKVLAHPVRDVYLQAVSGIKYPSADLEHPDCILFGCSPDFNAWNGKLNPTPNARGAKTFRSCGGHIHVGHVTGFDALQDEKRKPEIIKAMDTFVGIPSVILDDAPESIKRRSLYGKAGAWRPKEYGVEYRSLSNFWLQHPDLARFVYRATDIALRSVEEGVFQRIEDEKVTSIINTGNAKAADKVLVDLIDYYPELMGHFYKVSSLTSRKLKYRSVRQTWKL